MAPGGNKRKRPERQPSRDDGSGRPSPHRPQDLALAQQGQQYGGSRGGRGGGRQRQMPSSANSGGGSSQSRASPAAVQSPAAPVARDSLTIEESRPDSPSQSVAALALPPVDDTPREDPAPYWYDHLTDAIVESWDESGRTSILEVSKEADEITASTLLQELLRAGLDARIAAKDAGTVIRDMVVHHQDSDGLDIASIFVNTMSLLDDRDHASPNLLRLVAATNIDPEMMRMELDTNLLKALPLVRSTFETIRTRKTTNMLYRQANFNLLREESEGYAKLVTEYFNTANAVTKDQEISAEQAFERITALVGSFDLDVGRVLDITLDISANLLVRAYAFFIKFYRCSSWWPESGVIDNVQWDDQGFSSFPSWALPGAQESGPNTVDKRSRIHDTPDQAIKREARDVRFWERAKEVGMEAFFELGARKIVNFEEVLPLLQTELPLETDKAGREINANRRKRVNESRKYMAETGLLPPQGNPDAAQLLGFKLRFYASPARGPHDNLPDNLVFLAALLIKIGFISLRDLYPHLYPEDENMAEEKTRLEKEKREKEEKDRPGAGSNALAMAGALTDDTVPAVARVLRTDKERSGGTTPKPEKKEEEEAKPSLPTPANQKVVLLKALLLIGALPEAFYILGRFPWLVDVDYTLPPYLHRLANQMLTKVADLVRPLNQTDDTCTSRDELVTLLPRQDGTLLFAPQIPKKPTRWLGLDSIETGDGQMYLHYYPDWNDNIPLCQDIEDVFLLCSSFLGYLGVKVGQDAKLLGTLVRLAKHSLREDFSEGNQSRWLELMRRMLVPALSLSQHNAGLTQEVYELLMFFPTTTRYNIYAEWYYGKTSRLPDMRVAFEHNKAEVKDVLRRVTNESGKKQARALAKVSFSSPGNLMKIMIDQLESYSNMIPSLVECTRYFSPLAYDVLTWSLINSLSGQGRSRIQADGMLTSSWLQALSQFVASLFHRYTALNPSPVLQYLASELRAGNSTDLEMFEQLLAEMAGIRSDMEFNDAQVLAMAGGKILQGLTVQQLADKRHERRVQAQRLIKALSEPGLIGQTLISIAQERQMYSYHDSSKNMPLKVLGNNLDKIQLVFAQYLDVLKTNLAPGEFEAAVPDVVRLVADFGLEPGVAFTICRYCINQKIVDFDAAKKASLDKKKRAASQGSEQAQTNGDVEMQESKPVVNGEPPASKLSVVDMDTTSDSKAATSPQALTTEDDVRAAHPVLHAIVQQLSEAAPQLAATVSISFFVTFWTRSLQDIVVPSTSYDSETKKLRDKVKELNADRSDNAAAAVRERERKKKMLTETEDALREELKGRISTYQKTRNRISKEEKDHWFTRSMDRVESDRRHLGLLQECFLPRVLLSSLDAQYSFLMMKILHDNGTPGFSTMRCLAQLFRKQELANLIFQCTAMEAAHLGRFLCETLKLLAHWHSDKATYEREALGEKQKLPGFAKTLDANGDPQVVLDFEEYRRLLFNWHSYLNGALQICFESKEYMHIRNGITVLRAIVQVFPALNFMGRNMVTQVTRLSDEETRQDLKLAGKSLLGPLRRREKEWLMPQAFRLSDPSKEAAAGGPNGAASGRSEPSQANAGTPKLNAAAPDFKPVSSIATDGERKESVAGIEDGEIDDEKRADAQNGDAAMKDAIDSRGAANGSSSTEAQDARVTGANASVNTSRALGESTRPTSKQSTPAPIPTKPPPPEYNRSDNSRPPLPHSRSSRAHELPSRLPPKPAAAPTSSDRSARSHGGRGDESSYGRLSRPGDMRPTSRDHSPGTSRPRTPEREPYRGHLTPTRAPPRDDRGGSRGGREEAWVNNRRDQPPSSVASRTIHDSRERGGSGATPNPNQDRLAPPPAGSRTPTQQGARGQPSASTSAPAGQSDGQYHENPERMARINQEPQGPRERARESMPVQEGRRDYDGRDERSGLHSRQGDSRVGTHSASQDTQGRTDRSSELAPTGPKRSSGRLSRDFGAGTPSDAPNDRANGASDFPAGQRPPNGPSGGRGGRSAYSNEQPPSSQSTSRPGEPPSAFRPTGPRQAPDRRQSGHQFERQSPANSAPTTPATENAPQVHPSRLNRVDTMQPPQIQTNVIPPSAPRNSARPPAGTPTGPSSAGSGPPSGPASTTERQRRSNGRQLGNINATLQGGTPALGPNGQAVNFRGAASGRQTSGPTMSSATTQPVQAVASAVEPPARRSEAAQAERQDRPASRADPRADLFSGKMGSNNEDSRTGRPRRGEVDYPDRQRGSRNPSRERHPANNSGPPQDNGNRRPDERRPRDDRREPIPPSNNRYSDRGPRNDEYGRQAPPPPPPGAPSSFSNQSSADWERSNDRRGPPPPRDSERPRGNAPPDDYRGAPRREDGRPRDGRQSREFGGPPPPPPPPPGARKRRNEDPAGFDDAKRRRSGR